MSASISCSIIRCLRCEKPDPSYVGTAYGMPMSPGSVFHVQTTPDSAIVAFAPCSAH
ncbi:MAG: hypothetical protein ABI134_03385 [Byssovorax sp.]